MNTPDCRGSKKVENKSAGFGVVQPPWFVKGTTTTAFKDWQYLAHAVVNDLRQSYPDIDQDEADQEAAIGLLRAVRDAATCHDNFQAFARKRILDHLRVKFGTRRQNNEPQPLELDEEVHSGDMFSIDEDMADVLEWIEKADLSEIEKEALNLRWSGKAASSKRPGRTMRHALDRAVKKIREVGDVIPTNKGSVSWANSTGRKRTREVTPTPVTMTAFGGDVDRIRRYRAYKARRQNAGLPVWGWERWWSEDEGYLLGEHSRTEDKLFVSDAWNYYGRCCNAIDAEREPYDKWRPWFGLYSEAGMAERLQRRAARRPRRPSHTPPVEAGVRA